MKVKSWIKKIHEKLLMSGIRVDDTSDSQVTMVTTSNQSQNGSKNSIGGNSQNNKNNKYQKQERNGKRETDGPLVSECGLCSIIRNKEVPQEYLGIPFKERHREVSSRPIYPNDCLAWINLSLDDWEKVLHNNDLHCKMCLRNLKPGSRGSMCSVQ